VVLAQPEFKLFCFSCFYFIYLFFLALKHIYTIKL
jgi:hypothetical protein